MILNWMCIDIKIYFILLIEYKLNSTMFRLLL